MITRGRVSRGGPGGDDTTTDDNNNNEDQNNNTTIKQCTGDRGADNDVRNRQLAVGNIDNYRRQWRQALEGVDDGGGLRQHFGCGGRQRQQMAAKDSCCRGQLGGGGGLFVVGYEV